MIPDATFTLVKAKAHLRVTHAEEDALIVAMLDAAVAMCESVTRRAWTVRTWSSMVGACDLESCGCPDPAVFHAALSPAVAEVFATHSGSDVVVPATSYFMGTRYGHSYIGVRTWPTVPPDSFGDVARIDWTAAPPDDYVPPDVYAAAMLYLGDLYENREAQIVGTIVGQNLAAEMLLRSHVIEMHA